MQYTLRAHTKNSELLLWQLMLLPATVAAAHGSGHNACTVTGQQKLTRPELIAGAARSIFGRHT